MVVDHPQLAVVPHILWPHENGVDHSREDDQNARNHVERGVGVSGELPCEPVGDDALAQNYQRANMRDSPQVFHPH